MNAETDRIFEEQAVRYEMQAQHYAALSYGLLWEHHTAKAARYFETLARRTRREIAARQARRAA